MSKPSPTRYSTTNWSSYTAALRQRGSLLIWLDKDMTWLAPHDGRDMTMATTTIRIDIATLDGPDSCLVAHGAALRAGRTRLVKP
jgi:recombinational DNA repair ATPase RecF